MAEFKPFPPYLLTSARRYAAEQPEPSVSGLQAAAELRVESLLFLLDHLVDVERGDDPDGLLLREVFRNARQLLLDAATLYRRAIVQAQLRAADE